ncbi:MAG: hypothetical protein HFH60_08335 [Lachnospiraceae bacterium]|nr:hypothetical protein [Lachnospiraceae bacterium]
MKKNERLQGPAAKSGFGMDFPKLLFVCAAGEYTLTKVEKSCIVVSGNAIYIVKLRK